MSQSRPKDALAFYEALIIRTEKTSENVEALTRLLKQMEQTISNENKKNSMLIKTTTSQHLVTPISSHISKDAAQNTLILAEGLKEIHAQLAHINSKVVKVQSKMTQLYGTNTEVNTKFASSLGKLVKETEVSQAAYKEFQKHVFILGNKTSENVVGAKEMAAMGKRLDSLLEKVNELNYQVKATSKAKKALQGGSKPANDKETPATPTNGRRSRP